jgi:GNAT superfamily N-acetyltransferase
MQAMAPTEVVIRPAIEADVDTLRAVIARANESFRNLVAEELFASYLASAMDVERRLVEGEVLAAELDGGVVGTITFYRDARDEGMPVLFPDGTAGIRATAVDPVARGRGIGRAMVEACIDRATDAGATGVGLHTATFMVAAVTVYERCGFVRAPRYDFEWSQFFPADLGDVEQAIAYLRALP